MKIRKKLLIATAAGALFAILSWMVGMKSIEGIRKEFDHISNTTLLEISDLKNVTAQAFRMEMEAVSYATLLLKDAETSNMASPGVGENRANNDYLRESLQEELEEYNDAVEKSRAFIANFNKTFQFHLQDEAERAEEVQMDYPEKIAAAFERFQVSCSKMLLLSKAAHAEGKIFALMSEMETDEELFLKIVEEVISNEQYELTEDDEEVHSAVAAAMKLMIGISTIVFVIFLLTGWMLMRSVSEPLEKLIFSTVKIRDGDAAHRVNIDRRDEIGELAISFNRMLDELAHAKVVESQKKELEQLNLALKKKNDALDSFVYRVSHDLKAPIINIASLMGLLKGKISAEDRFSRQTVGFMEGSLQKLQFTIYDLLEVSRIERHLALQAEGNSLQAVVEEIKNNISEQIRQEDALIETDFSAAPNLFFAKPNLQSILSNLLTNAIKYRSPERRPHVLLKSLALDGNFFLTIQDNGLGMDLERQGSKLFQMFSRLHDHVEGTGVGLYIVKKLVEESGGEISVESQPGKGTIFTIQFPNQNHLTHATTQHHSAGR